MNVSFIKLINIKFFPCIFGILYYNYFMKIEIQTEAKTFSITEMNFSDIKAIRDACKLFAKSGSTSADKILTQIEEVIENAVI
jgi:hypothetical protein